MLYDTEMTAASAFPELAPEMHGHPCTGRVLEQATGERLIDFSGDAPLRGYLGLTIRCLMPGSMT
jgi:hypothetical protein